MADNARHSTIGGGKGNIIKAGSNNSSGTGATGSFIGGGFNNIITGSNNRANFIGSGCEMIIQESCFSVIGGGYGALINNSDFSFIGVGADKGGGIFNSNYSSIVNTHGSSKICLGTANFIGGGNDNDIFSSFCSAILGGKDFKIVSSSFSVIGGGNCNTISSSLATGQNCLNFIGGGCNNNICHSDLSSILGGKDNTIRSFDNTHIIGSSLTSTVADTTYMNNTTVACHLQVGGTTTMNATAGRIDATNDVVAFATSDIRLKENIQPINDALCKVIGVSGNTFDWKELNQEEIKTIHGNTGRDVGVIAQEIEEILPEAVTTRDNGYKAVNYEKIVPLLIEAIKEQQKQIDELKSKV